MLMLLLMLMVTALSLTATYSSCLPTRLFSLPPDTFSVTLASPANCVVTSIQKSGVKCDMSRSAPAKHCTHSGLLLPLASEASVYMTVTWTKAAPAGGDGGDAGVWREWGG